MKLLFAACIPALALAVTVATPANAQAGGQDRARSVQAKLFANAVLPDGKITDVNIDRIGLPVDLQTKVNDNVVPTVAVEYFFTSNISVETICCLTQHDVDGTTVLVEAELVADAKLVPAMLTAKYHLPLGPVTPYAGAGPALFIFIDEKPGAATVPLGVTDLSLSNEVGIALQAGVDIPVNDSGLAVSFDAKRYFIGTTAR
ncbi:OmpW family outer membrane protein [Croceicoccus sp. F390]|uniref:OmpW family outer membrane protein n=1 Tax=Croceicoccus esteveae TaxID=3075597 RepID=A0ABU2ZEC1_9SPHN|nr:OmpW family outer membrane protein [Croceicoccus sp. F390]MDT0574940.1 OmpW family outer membrane protein [Croceicoccus sp. F390]